MPLELVTDKERRKAAAAIRAKQQAIFGFPSVSIGNCAKCPVKDICQFANEQDQGCRAAELAIRQFEHEVERSPWVKEEDALRIRSLSAVWASLVVAEIFFRKYGSITIRKVGGTKQMAFSAMHDQYMRLLERFDEGLDAIGLSPIGRKALRSGGMAGASVPGGLLEYLQTKKKAKDTKEEESNESTEENTKAYTPGYQPQKKDHDKDGAGVGEDISPVVDG